MSVVPYFLLFLLFFPSVKARVGWHQRPWSRNGVILKGIHWATLKKKKRQRKCGKMCKKVKRLDEEKAQMEEPGVEPGASYMRSTRSTTELHPLLLRSSLGIIYKILLFF